ncbi:hypothetical protein PK1910_06990 [Veillonella parvula]|uniref:hypothetical protein n=1 Tax=Veillonella parvula TaxID=29466 RepID=UPI00073D233A|nr:hypothetical protein AT982_02015 [Veillonella parvula]
MTKDIGLNIDEINNITKEILARLDTSDEISKAIYDLTDDYPDLAATLSDNEKLLIKTFAVVSNRIIFSITPALISSILLENNKAILKAFEEFQRQ